MLICIYYDNFNKVARCPRLYFNSQTPLFYIVAPI